MIKVFLVEDEIVIRRGIRDNIDWEGNGFEFVGEAGDGEYAYPLILKTEPDILLTDVKMAFMDGLELSHLVKKALPQTKIIILSGYDEFEYAKKAIAIGVSDYLLKPVTSANLMEVLKKAAATIYEERERSRLLERYFISYEKYMEFLDETDFSGVNRKLIHDFLRLGSVSECSSFVDEYFAAVGENNYQSLLLRQYLVMDIFYCIQEFLRQLELRPEEVPEEETDIRHIPKAIVNVDMTKIYLKQLFTLALTLRDGVSGNRYGTLIDDAKSYIYENYSNRDFSLNMISAHIGVSPSYFSSIFKLETGRSFIEFLTKVRIDKACELLKCTSLRAAEVGDRVGYHDPRYFSATFRKIMGQSPTEFKNNNKGGGTHGR